MKQIWRFISTLGLENPSRSLYNRTIVLSNRLNFVLMFILIILNVAVTIIRHNEGGTMSIGSIRILVLLFISILTFVFSYYRLFLVTKIVLVFVPSLVIIVLPTLIGFVEEESFFYYPLSIIGLSIIPQLIFIPKIDKKIYLFSIAYFFLLLTFIYNLLVFFSPVKYAVFETISKFRFFYQFIPVAAFIFIHMALYYLRALNLNYENDILSYNNELNNTIKELRQTQQHLVQSEKMASIGTLTAGVAHEINNPLNFINGGLNLVKEIKQSLNNGTDNDLKEKCNLASTIIETGIQRASVIVSSLMDFSYRGNPKLIPSDISEVIENTLLFLNAKINEDVKIIKEYKLDIKVPIYKDKIHQVILNIIDNAIYSVNLNEDDSPKLIKIVTKQEENKAVIIISNNGPRIPDDDISKIFDPFYTTKEPGRGTGLGLSISYSLVNEHKGEIVAENRDDGVYFIIKLPVNN